MEKTHKGKEKKDSFWKKRPKNKNEKTAAPSEKGKKGKPKMKMTIPSRKAGKKK